MKMKANFICCFLLFLFLISCQKSGQEPNQNTNIEIFYKGQYFNLSSEAGIQGFVKNISKREEVQIVESSILDMEDDIGVFKAFKAKYITNEGMVSILIPLELTDGVAYSTGCTMSCSAWLCGICTQEIVVRCKSQQCACNEVGGGGCNSSIEYEDIE